MFFLFTTSPEPGPRTRRRYCCRRRALHCARVLTRTAAYRRLLIIRGERRSVRKPIRQGTFRGADTVKTSRKRAAGGLAFAECLHGDTARPTQCRHISNNAKQTARNAVCGWVRPPLADRRSNASGRRKTHESKTIFRSRGRGIYTNKELFGRASVEFRRNITFRPPSDVSTVKLNIYLSVYE